MYGAPYAVGAYSEALPTATQAYFFPPIVSDIPNYLPNSRADQKGLWRHYRLKNRGVNVFLLSDGTYVQDTATVENPNSGMPLPWIINDPSGPYSYTTNFDGTIETASLNPYIVKVYEGGHLHPVSTDEAAALTAAGYQIIYE